ncbi:acetyl-CoA acetyltransferase [Nocardioides daeguensis]|uniref:Acetyl-CoA acetyltransferase n=1 Tax=Nocardioides daeguensis TaxID=908359 RepID=A0ABP6V3Q2_9ACTN|nr:acetyl-CoA acetyltransferase [Nocardioides daeguensis]MBV6726500.1 acetyl-CoA acetyltransferase [Nocardioides daeguensis]MCR1772343.1 acetyl-CoA acetyltransferase [Nocardioides daeguensis]
MDPRTPVLVGGGQLNQREDPVEPVDMIVAAARLAAEDAGAPALAEAVQSVRVIGMLSWRYRDPGALVGERLGAPVRHTVYTGNGGSHPQALVNDAAEDIAAGRVDVVLVGGAEAWRTRMALRAQGEKPAWTRQGEDVGVPETRPDVPMQHATELRAGIDRPTSVYPLFEQAIRVAAGRSVEEHRRHIAGLWARFSEVAAGNPAAWSRRTYSADEIMTASPTNRMVAWPYTKLLSSNNSVEQAAAVLVCSVEAATRMGVPRERWVFPRSGSEASDTSAIAARPGLDRSPAIRLAGAAALSEAGLSVEQLGPIDIYSCFPSAVQVAAAELGLPIDDPSRPLTVTGGLTFAGGPWNNYSTHAIATMLAEVRRTGAPGLVSANSGYLTKHSMGIYAPDPGPRFGRVCVQDEVDAVPRTPVAVEHEGPATLESWTVLFDRDGAPETALAALRTSGGARTLARSTAADVLAALVGEDEAAGMDVRVSADATFSLK